MNQTLNEASLSLLIEETFVSRDYRIAKALIEKDLELGLSIHHDDIMLSNSWYRDGEHEQIDKRITRCRLRQDFVHDHLDMIFAVNDFKKSRLKIEFSVVNESWERRQDQPGEYPETLKEAKENNQKLSKVFEDELGEFSIPMALMTSGLSDSIYNWYYLSKLKTLKSLINSDHT